LLPRVEVLPCPELEPRPKYFLFLCEPKGRLRLDKETALCGVLFSTLAETDFAAGFLAGFLATAAETFFSGDFLTSFLILGFFSVILFKV